MTGRTSSHYGMRSVYSMWPCVEVVDTSAGTAKLPVVVKRLYGITMGHAVTRALKWMNRHGDPR